jgi:hypothetical protein
MGFFSNASSIPSVGSEMGQVAGSTVANYGPMMAALQGQLGKSYLADALAQYNAAAAVSPMYQQLQTGMYQQAAPQLAQIGLGIGQQMQAGQAGVNAAVAGGPQGQAALQAAIAADKAANPEFYAARQAGAQRIGDLLGSVDLTGALSGGEQRAIQQGLDVQAARTGQLNAPSAINAVSNATQYGNAAYQRQEQAKQDLNTALGTATSFLPASQSGVGGMNAWNIATGGPNTATNQGVAAQGNFLGVNQGAGSFGAQQAGSLLGQMFGAGSSYGTSAMQAKATQPTGFQNVLGGIQAIGSLTSGAGAGSGGGNTGAMKFLMG